MADKLAKLDGTDGLKALLGQAQTANDAVLTMLLKTASAIAEREAGLAPGALRRQTAIEEYPSGGGPGGDQSRFAYLAVRPIEAIDSVKQLYYPGTDAEFDAVSELTEFEEYLLADADLGKLERVNSVFYLRSRCLQVVYNGGYADPEDALPSGASFPPVDLQHGVLQQAILLWNTRDKAGIDRVDLASGGGFAIRDGMRVHPALTAAVQRHRRLLL